MTGLSLTPAPAAVAAPAPGATTTPAAVPGNVAPPTDVSVPGGQVGSAPGTTTPASTDWTTGLDEVTRAQVTSKGWKSPADMAKSYGELERLMSSRPATTSEPVPAAATDYTFKAPENPEAVKYNGALAEQLKGWAHEGKLTQAQANVIHDKAVSYLGEQAAAMEAAATQELTAKLVSSKNEISGAWGEPGTPLFDRNSVLAQRAIRELGLTDQMEALGAFTKVPGADGKDVMQVTNSKLIMALAKIGGEMFAEDTLFGNPAASGVNPFDEKTLDLQAQGRIYMSDPAKARALIMSLPGPMQARYGDLLSKIK